MLVHFFILGTGYSLDKNVKHCQFPRAGRKVPKFYIQPKKCVICSNSSLFFIFQRGLFYVNNNSRTFLNQNLIFFIHKNQLEKSILTMDRKRMKNRSNKGLKYQLQALLCICQRLDTKYYTSVACASSFLLISNILI